MEEATPYWLERVKAASDEHVHKAESILPGYIAFRVDVDVQLGLWNQHMVAGTYFLRAGDMMNEAYVYQVDLNIEELISQIEEGETEELVDDNGVTFTAYKSKAPLDIKAKTTPIELKEKGSRKHNLTYFEMLVWLAISVAETREESDEIFYSAYQNADKLPKQTGKKADRRYDPATKLYQKITDPGIYDLVLKVDAAGRAERKKGREAITALSFEYVGDSDDVKLGRPVDEFDKLVLNGVISQAAAGRSVFTAADVFEAVTGSKNPNRKQLADYTESLDKMRFTKVTVDMTSEAKAHGFTNPDTGEPLKSWEVETYLVNASKIMVDRENGRAVEGYLLNEEPVLYTHARMTKQIVSYPIKYLDTKEVGSNTRQNNLIKNYLIDRIIRAKSGKLSPCIRYATVYNHAGVDKENRVARKRANDYIAGLLGKWKSQGLIRDYEIQKEGQQVAKATVYFGKGQG